MCREAPIRSQTIFVSEREQHLNDTVDKDNDNDLFSSGTTRWPCSWRTCASTSAPPPPCKCLALWMVSRTSSSACTLVFAINRRHVRSVRLRFSFDHPKASDGRFSSFPIHVRSLCVCIKALFFWLRTPHDPIHARATFPAPPPPAPPILCRSFQISTNFSHPVQLH